MHINDHQCDGPDSAKRQFKKEAMSNWMFLKNDQEKSRMLVSLWFYEQMFHVSFYHFNLFHYVHFCSTLQDQVKLYFYDFCHYPTVNKLHLQLMIVFIFN